MKVLGIDELGVLNNLDLSINYTPYKYSESETRKTKNHLVGPKYFITKSQKLYFKNSKVKKIVAHAGGNGDYSKVKNIYIALDLISKKLSISVDWICPNKISLKSLKDVISIPSKDRVIDWITGSNSLWAPYDMVVGPSSTSVYEAIMQGSLPLSFPINKTQLTDREDWLSIGHALHMNNNDLGNLSLIKNLIEIAIKNNILFLKNLANYSSKLDGKGTEKIVNKIESFIDENNKDKLTLRNYKFLVNGINECPFFLAESFLKARNSPNVRNMSTDRNHIISWPEHLNWWLNGKAKKYFLVEESIPTAYFWVKTWQLKDGNFITAGWFPASNTTNIFSILKVMDWQINYFAKKYPGFIWISTIKDSNKGAMALNKRFGFVPANKSTLKVIPLLYPGTNKNFKVFEFSC